MAIRIKLVDDPAQIDEILRLRYQVFSIDEGLWPANAAERIVDRFDAFPSSKHFAVIAEGRVVGAIRITLDSSAGMAADEYFDFRNHLPMGARPAHVSMMCVHRDFRQARLSIGLLLMSIYYGIAEGFEHMVAPLNPALGRMMAQNVGATALTAENQVAPHNGVVFLPIVMSATKLSDQFLNFIRANELYNLMGLYECLFFEEGETIIRRGERGEEAFVLIEGDACVTSDPGDPPIANLGPGDVFGELALLTDDVRTTSVVASTPVRTMVMPKTGFLTHLRENPDSAINLLKTVGQRMSDLLRDR